MKILTQLSMCIRKYGTCLSKILALSIYVPERAVPARRFATRSTSSGTCPGCSDAVSNAINTISSATLHTSLHSSLRSL